MFGLCNLPMSNYSKASPLPTFLTVWGKCWGMGDLGGGSPVPNTDPPPLPQNVYSHWAVLGGSVTCLRPRAMEKLTILLDLNPSTWDSVTSGFSFGLSPLQKI